VVARACKTISHSVGKGALGDILGSADTENIQGEVQKKLDVISNEILLEANEWGGHLAAMASEEMESIHPIPNRYPMGEYMLLFDPLDGSSNIDVNVSIGTIFSVLKAPEGMGQPTEADFMQPGSQAGRRRLCRVRPADHAGAHHRQWRQLLHAGPRDGFLGADPEATCRFRPRPRNSRSTCRTSATGIRRCSATSTKCWPADRSARQGLQHALDRLDGGRRAPHPEPRRHLHVPGRPRDPSQPGKLRLMYEANPMALIVEQAGGAATDGRSASSTSSRTKLHQRVPVFLGSKKKSLKCPSIDARSGIRFSHGTYRPFYPEAQAFRQIER
jgi:fructose-1,6-bisphosphatase I